MLNKLFTPGPVQISKTVLKEMYKPIIFHRTASFEKLYKNVTEKLIKIFDANQHFVTLILTGSGTMANEAVISSLIGRKDKLLIISNGQFSERLATIAKIHNINLKILDFGWGNAIELSRLEIEIEKYNPTWIATVLLETSIGIVNPINKIGKLCKKYNSKFLVDAVSGLGAEKLSITKDNIDVCVSVPNKALESAPGISFVCLRKDLISNLKTKGPRSYYLDLSRYFEISLKYQTPTTPAISIIVSLNKALDILIKETLTARQNRYKYLSSLVIKYCNKLQIEILIKNKGLKANAITTLVLRNHESAEKLQKYLERHGFTVWHHPYNKRDKKFDCLLQISVMGDIDKKDIKNLFSKIVFFQNIYGK